jgi:hypothetical protein
MTTTGFLAFTCLEVFTQSLFSKTPTPITLLVPLGLLRCKPVKRHQRWIFPRDLPSAMAAD